MLCPFCHSRICRCRSICWLYFYICLFAVIICSCSSTPLSDEIRRLDTEIEALRKERSAAVNVEYALKDAVDRIEFLEEHHRSGREIPFDKKIIVDWYESSKKYSSSISDLIREREKERNELINKQSR